jgi:hypothetical protein
LNSSGSKVCRTKSARADLRKDRHLVAERLAGSRASGDHDNRSAPGIDLGITSSIFVSQLSWRRSIAGSRGRSLTSCISRQKTTALAPAESGKEQVRPSDLTRRPYAKSNRVELRVSWLDPPTRQRHRPTRSARCSAGLRDGGPAGHGVLRSFPLPLSRLAPAATPSYGDRHQAAAIAATNRQRH